MGIDVYDKVLLVAEELNLIICPDLVTSGLIPAVLSSWPQQSTLVRLNLSYEFKDFSSQTPVRVGIIDVGFRGQSNYSTTSASNLEDSVHGFQVLNIIIFLVYRGITRNARIYEYLFNKEVTSDCKIEDHDNLLSNLEMGLFTSTMKKDLFNKPLAADLIGKFNQAIEDDVKIVNMLMIWKADIK